MKDKMYLTAHICLFIAVFTIGKFFCKGEILDSSGVFFGIVLAIIVCTVLHLCIRIAGK